jgi:hypothetical protein
MWHETRCLSRSRTVGPQPRIARTGRGSRLAGHGWWPGSSPRTPEGPRLTVHGSWLRGSPGTAVGPTTKAGSVVVQLAEAVVVDARMVAQLVDDRDAHLLLEVCWIGEIRLQG